MIDSFPNFTPLQVARQAHEHAHTRWAVNNAHGVLEPENSSQRLDGSQQMVHVYCALRYR